ncbi:MAG: hypothetical protein ABI837_12740, partial [Acidobacteriota bacterium]
MINPEILEQRLLQKNPRINIVRLELLRQAARAGLIIVSTEEAVTQPGGQEARHAQGGVIGARFAGGRVQPGHRVEIRGRGGVRPTQAAGKE